jgi:mannose-6-phosphate isomerase-like protein (cupin superfamily)
VSITVRRWNRPEDELQLGTLRRQLEAEGMRTAWYSEVPGVVFDEHQHGFAESRWVLSGYLHVEAGGRFFALGPGDRIDLPAHTLHRVHVLGLTPVVYVTGAPPDAAPHPASV